MASILLLGASPQTPREGFEVRNEFVLWLYHAIAVKRLWGF
ncbi:hypothetical protein [Helicobacter gastrofelis]|nr:hypothetical protein [Helicobacter sp. NHP19-012]